MNIFSIVASIFVNTWTDKVAAASGVGLLLFQDIPAPTQADSWDTIFKWAFVALFMIVVRLIGSYVDFKIKEWNIKIKAWLKEKTHE